MIMKSSLKFLFFISTGCLLFFSCNKPAVRIIESGIWMVSLYTEDSKDETSEFAGYKFDFNKNELLTVTMTIAGSTNTVNGTWTYDDASSKYRISISGTGNLDKVNGDWTIISKSKDLIELKDDNPTKKEFLNFKKI